MGGSINFRILVATATSGIIFSLVFSGGSEELLPTSPPLDSELILTLEEKLAFDKFKAAVFPNITSLAGWKEYIGHDLYLLRWIRAKNLDVEKATNEMTEFIRLIQSGTVDEVMTDEFPDVAPDFPIYETKDKEGRTVFYMSMTDGWNFRRGILQGKRARMLLCTLKVVLQAVKTVLDPRANHTQAWILMDMDGFNVFQHGCPACISYYQRMLQIFEQYAPGCIKETIVINAPMPFLVVLELMRPVLSPQTRKNLRVFGTNRNSWKSYLEQRIGSVNLPLEFGGSN